MDFLNNLQLLEIWDALIKLEVASEGILSEEIKIIEKKIEKIEYDTNKH